MKTIRILNNGVGTQSSTILAMSIENRKAMQAKFPLPYPLIGIIDLSIFADPKEEEKAVYENLKWQQSISPPDQPIFIRSAGKLGDHLKTGTNSTGGRFAAIPLFTSNHIEAAKLLKMLSDSDPYSFGSTSELIRKTLRDFAYTVGLPGSDESDETNLLAAEMENFHKRLAVDLLADFNDGNLMRVRKTIMENTQYGKVRRQCTKEYKTQVVDRFIRQEILGLESGARIPKDVTHIEQVIGISLDEAGRAVRIKARFRDTPWSEPLFPLIAMEFTRKDCQEWLRAYGIPHEPPRSACTFCPFHNDEEWLRLKQLPDEWARIVEIDHAIRTPGNVVNRTMNQSMYLHRSCLPINEVNFLARIEEKRRLAAEKRDVQATFFDECEGMCGH